MILTTKAFPENSAGPSRGEGCLCSGAGRAPVGPVAKGWTSKNPSYCISENQEPRWRLVKTGPTAGGSTSRKGKEEGVAPRAMQLPPNCP